MKSFKLFGRKHGLFILMALGILLAISAPSKSAGGYHVTSKYVIGGSNSWDYLTVDPESRRLYVTHATKVEVIDADTGKSIGQVADTPGVHGVAIVRDLGKGFATDGTADKVTVFDLKTLAHISEINVGKKPDFILYDSGMREIFVADGESNQMTAIDPASLKVLGTIDLGGGPENIMSDLKGTLWINLEKQNSFVTVDAKALKLKKTTPLAGCQEPGPMAIDRSTRRLFISCSANKILAVVDADEGNIIAKLPIGERVDAAMFDSENRLIFLSAGEGIVTEVHEDTPDKYTVVETIKSMRGAKTMTFDPKTKKLFLSTAVNVPATETGPPRPSGPGAYQAGPLIVVVIEK